MPNIKFSYLYRDGGNNKNHNSIIFDNPDNIEVSVLEKLIKSNLIDGMWFYVNEWKLPDLHFKTWCERIDHGWHEFESIEYSEDLSIRLDSMALFIHAVKKTNWYKTKMEQGIKIDDQIMARKSPNN
jgi:hypothetical protein